MMTILLGLVFSDVIKLDHSRRDASCSLARWASLLAPEVLWDGFYIAMKNQSNAPNGRTPILSAF
jgi:hypothetical protein